MSVPGAAGPPEPLASPRQIGPFSLTARIGAGRRTTAYIAHRQGEDRPFVVRELHRHVDPEVFQAELMNARGLVVGEASVPLERFGPVTVASAPLVVGESLATILHDAVAGGMPLDHDVALAVAMGIARELDTLGGGFIHGDLMPHHVIVGYDGLVRLIDPAGDAYRERASADTRSGYRSPEHVRCDPLCPQSDVYVLGILLFEMTTAHRLFREPTQHDNDTRIVEGHLPRPRDIIGDGYPIELQLVLRKLLRPAAAGRFANGTAARDALRLVATTRNEIGSSQVGGWLESRYPDRFSVWRRLVGDDALRPPLDRATTAVTGGHPAAEVRARQARQQTPTEAISIPDEPTMQTGAPSSNHRTLEQPIAGFLKEPATGVERTLPDEPSGARGLDELTEPLPKKDRRSRRPARLIPDVPTEITKKAPPRLDTIQDAPVMGDIEGEDSDRITSLDEIEMIQRSLDALALPGPPPLLAEANTPTPNQMTFDPLDPPTSQADVPPFAKDLGASDPPALEVLDDADIEISQDLPETEGDPVAAKAPVETGATPAPDLSADLVLAPPSSDLSHPPVDLTADLLDPGEDLAGDDTIQDQDAEALLDEAILHQVKAHVLDEPKPWEQPPPPKEPIPLTERKPERSVDTEIVRRRDIRPREADIPTHVVRDRIEANASPLEDLPLASEPPSLDSTPPLPDPGSMPPPDPGPMPPPDPGPMAAPDPGPMAAPDPDAVPSGPPESKAQPRRDTDLLPLGAQVAEPIVGREESSLGDLVIPVADDELARSRRSRWISVALIAGLTLVLLAGGGLILFIQEERPVVALPSPIGETAPDDPMARELLETPDPPENATSKALAQKVVPPDAGAAAPDAGTAAPDAGAVEVVPAPPPPRTAARRRRRGRKPKSTDEPRVRKPPKPKPPSGAPPPEAAPPATAVPEGPPPEAPPPEAPPPEAPEQAPPPEAPEQAPPPEAPPPTRPTVTQVRVRALPEEAVIVVNGEYELENGGLIEVGEEPIRIVAKAEGWEDKTETIQPGRTKDVLLLLRKK